MGCKHEDRHLHVQERYSEFVNTVVCDTVVQLVRHVKVCRCNMCGERVHKTVTEGKDLVKQIEEKSCQDIGRPTKEMR